MQIGWASLSQLHAVQRRAQSGFFQSVIIVPITRRWMYKKEQHFRLVHKRQAKGWAGAHDETKRGRAVTSAPRANSLEACMGRPLAAKRLPSGCRRRAVSARLRALAWAGFRFRASSCPRCSSLARTPQQVWKHSSASGLRSRRQGIMSVSRNSYQGQPPPR